MSLNETAGFILTNIGLAQHLHVHCAHNMLIMDWINNHQWVDFAWKPYHNKYEKFCENRSPDLEDDSCCTIERCEIVHIVQNAWVLGRAIHTY